MELYIQIKNEQAFQHPILGDNFRQAFPDIDTNNLPSTFARFTRLPEPVLGVYEVCDGCTYEWEGDEITDVHHVRVMTAAEKIVKQDAAKTNWIERGFASWSFNESTCLFDPPTPHPNDDKQYNWNEEILAWDEVTEVAPNE
tara:strand:- start:1682 stop:2107 length:426 start_codon:yes stop_codon:yes gene_type:complete